MNGNKFATGEILKKPVEVVKGRILVGWAQKSPEPWLGLWSLNTRTHLFTRLENKIEVDFSAQSTILRRFYACIR